MNAEELKTLQQFRGIASASQLKGWLFESWPLSESLQRFLGNSVHLNRPGKKQISGLGLPLISVTENEIKKIRPYNVTYAPF